MQHTAYNSLSPQPHTAVRNVFAVLVSTGAEALLPVQQLAAQAPFLSAAFGVQQPYEQQNL